MTKTRKGFYVGDPSYVLPYTIYTQIWGEKHNYANFPKGLLIPILTHLPTQGDFTVEDHYMLVHGTAYGDGTYTGNDGYKFTTFSVCSGTLACIPLELVTQTSPSNSYVLQVEKLTEAHMEYNTGEFVFTFSNGISLNIQTGDKQTYKSYLQDYKSKQFIF